MKRLAIVLGATAVAALALAAITVVGARGGGFVRNSTGAECYAWMDVKKATDGTTVRVGGPARFETRQVREGHHIRTEVLMHNAGELAKVHNVCNFAGRAIKRIWVDGVLRHTAEGRLACRVTDRRSPTHPNPEPDLVDARFYAPSSNVPAWAFAGGLVRGDIVVYERTEQ